MSDSHCSSCFKQTITPWSLCLVFISSSNVITLWIFFFFNSGFFLCVESASIINDMKLTWLITDTSVLQLMKCTLISNIHCLQLPCSYAAGTGIPLEPAHFPASPETNLDCRSFVDMSIYKPHLHSVAGRTGTETHGTSIKAGGMFIRNQSGVSLPARCHRSYI